MNANDPNSKDNVKIILNELTNAAVYNEGQWFVSILSNDQEDAFHYGEGTIGFLLDIVIYLCDKIFNDISSPEEYVIIKSAMDDVMSILRKYNRKHNKEIKEWKEKNNE